MKKVPVTLSAILLSVLSGTTPNAAVRSSAAGFLSFEQEALRRCGIYRKAFPMTEIALPAIALRTDVVAKWVRDHGLAVDVRTGEELGVAIATGIHPSRLTVHADMLHDSELCAAARLGVGRVAVSSIEQIDLLASAEARRKQGVVVRMTDANMPDLSVVNVADGSAPGFPFDSDEADGAVRAILDDQRLDLVGLHCEVGSHEHDFISYPAAIGHMIAEMTQIRRHHGAVLTRLGLGGRRCVPSGDWAVELPELASEIDESLDDACATLRFPRPLVVLSTGLRIVGQQAA